MDQKNSTLILLRLMVMMSILGIVTGLFELGRIERLLKRDTASEASQIKNKFVQEHSAEAEINFSAHWHSQQSDALVDPKTLLPQPHLLDDAPLLRLLKVGEQCSPELNSPEWRNPGSQKLLNWYLHSCRHETLSEDFFSHEPYIHPLGGSWVAWAFKHSPNSPYTPEWLRQHKPLLHLSELSLLPSEALDASERALSTLGPAELESLLSGDSFVLGARYAFLLYQATQGQTLYRAYFVHDWDKALEWTGLRTSRGLHDSSLIHDGQVSWTYAASLQPEWKIRWIAVSLSSVLILISAVIAMAWMRRKEIRLIQEDHELIVQTLAHELRHPATSLQLSLEVLRQRLDDFPETEKHELLRMCDQTQRLQRLIHASRQYLGVWNGAGSPFRFNWVDLPSLNEYFEDVVDPYRAKIEFSPLASDSAGTLDPYWLAMCVANLIKNALIHGAPPIQVSLAMEGALLRVSVEDAGSLPSGNLEFLMRSRSRGSKGLGLGLSLVERLSRLMGGRLVYETKPKKCFSILLEIRREAHLAG